MSFAAPAESSPPPVRDRAPLRFVAGATLLVAILGWVLLIVVGRAVGPTSYGEFSVVWSLILALFSVLLGVQQEVVRAVSTTRRDPERPRRGASLLATAFVTGCLLLALFLVSSPLWADRVFEADAGSVLAASSLGALCYLVTLTINGVLIGRRELRLYAGVIVADGAVRFVCVITATALGARVVGWSWAIAAAGLTWVLFLPLRPVREALAARGDATLYRQVYQASILVGGAACSTLLVVGFPALLTVMSAETLDQDAGVLLALVTLTRAPIVLPLIAFQGVAIAWFVAHPTLVLRRTLVALAGLVGLGLVGGLAGATVGPFVLRLVLGEQFDSTGRLVAGLAVTAACLGMLTVTGTALVGLARQATSTLGWLLATVATAVILSTSMPLERRTVVALAVGPLSGVAFHLFGIWRAQRDITPALP